MIYTHQNFCNSSVYNFHGNNFNLTCYNILKHVNYTILYENLTAVTLKFFQKLNFSLENNLFKTFLFKIMFRKKNKTNNLWIKHVLLHQEFSF